MNTALYVHIPFCMRKCPYCDFNSYKFISAANLEENYLFALLEDLRSEAARFKELGRSTLSSIFIGGGTPSIFSADSITRIINDVYANFLCADDLEMTIEANPGTIDLNKCRALRKAGCNRISLGVQSFQDKYLRSLGRIHNGFDARHAIDAIQKAEFDNFNIDLMFGLPGQNIADALNDLKTALSFSPMHISWYQLTLEEDTEFYAKNPVLPHEDEIFTLQQEGIELLRAAGFNHYEISAYCKDNYQCRHNVNYWEFGDYIGVGAGAHGKITDEKSGKIARYWKIKNPQEYIQARPNFTEEEKIIADAELPFEFMLNALRLYKPIPFSLFEQRTGLRASDIKKSLQEAQRLKLLQFNDVEMMTTPKGKIFLNDLLEVFM